MNKGNKIDLKEKAYRYIKDKIISGEFKSGMDIDEKELQNILGISRTPVREALFKLENDNLVDIYPRKGIFVTSITPKLIKNVFQIRLIVEPQVLRIVAPVTDKKYLEELKGRFMNNPENLKDKDLTDYYVGLDKEFHSYLNDLCENIYLTKMMDNILEQNERLRHQTYDVMERDKETTEEHLKIIEYLIQGDYDKAEKELVEHLRKSEEIAFKYIML
jgi:DNA-binding GntR family transcriptional regulator